MKQRKFMKRMMVILMGLILLSVSILQIIQKGNVPLNLVFAFLGLFEIGLSIFMMRVEKKATKNTSLTETGRSK